MQLRTQAGVEAKRERALLYLLQGSYEVTSQMVAVHAVRLQPRTDPRVNAIEVMWELAVYATADLDHDFDLTSLLNRALVLAHSVGWYPTRVVGVQGPPPNDGEDDAQTTLPLDD